MVVDAPASAHPTLLGVPMKWVSLVMLVAQTVSVVFAMRLSRTAEVDGKRYLNTTAVFFSELLKLACSFLFLCNEKGSASAAAALAKQHLLRNPKETLKVCVPSLLYTVQNNLLFISLSNLSGAVYQVTYQLKILTTAVLSVIVLGKALGPTKWCSLLLLTGGVALIQLPRGDGASDESAGAGARAAGSTGADATAAAGSAAVGLVAVLSACMTSGLAGVYLEKILKQSDASIWVRNIQLGFFGAILAMLGCFLTDGARIRADGFLQGYSPLVWGVIVLQAVGGLVVAAVLKYADNILKCFGNALSIVLSCMLSATFLGEFTPDLLFVLGTLLVLVATSMYSLGVPQVLLNLVRPLTPKSKMDFSGMSV
eukprot:TRINITY_DN26553_c0_g1_i1.p1 TRINITY_DN26553_c0_g1~~TRINITY_DN26553_c0_g1_i1.p1  ORF type:complete len:430 (-),score=105.68 TRINITY_DN26553_c0_g1_i1:345-1451(-)